MNKKDLHNILEETKDLFLKKDKYLLLVNVNERSLTHKFAEHLQNILKNGWSVDCEYNRYGDNIKKIDNIKSIVDCNVKIDDLAGKTIYPDIIIHKRGRKGSDLLVIEAKKDPTEKEKDNDIAKLKEIKKTI